MNRKKNPEEHDAFNIFACKTGFIVTPRSNRIMGEDCPHSSGWHAFSTRDEAMSFIQENLDGEDSEVAHE